LRKSFSEIFSLNDHFQPRVRNILWNLYLGRARSENTFKSQAISFLIVAGKMFSGKKGAILWQIEKRARKVGSQRGKAGSQRGKDRLVGVLAQIFSYFTEFY